MKIIFLINVLLIISVLQNYQTVYTYEEPLAKLWNVSYRELPTYLGYEKKLTMVDRLLQPILEEYNTNFGGTFIKVRRNKIFINVVKPDRNHSMRNMIKSSMRNYSSLLTFIPVKNSITTLRYTFDQILIKAKRLKPIRITCFITTQHNSVILKSYQSEDEQNRKFFDAIKQISRYNETVIHINLSEEHNVQHFFADDIMETNIIDTGNLNYRIMAGDGLYNKDYEHVCSWGFWAKSKDLKSTYFVTVGHCANSTNQPFYHSPWNLDKYRYLMGYMKYRSVFPLDVGLIFIDNEKIINDLIKTAMVIKNVDSKENEELIVVDYATVTSIGAHMCKSGYETHVTCGDIIGINGFITEFGGEMMHPLTFSTTNCDFGDSGGAVFTYKQDMRNVCLNGMIIYRGELSRIISGILSVDVILREFNLMLNLKDGSNSSNNTG